MPVVKGSAQTVATADAFAITAFDVPDAKVSSVRAYVRKYTAATNAQTSHEAVMIDVTDLAANTLAELVSTYGDDTTLRDVLKKGLYAILQGDSEIPAGTVS